MRISINVAHHAWPEGPKGSAAQVERVVAAADEIGLDSVWVADHLRQAEHDDPEGSPDEAVLEAYETLGSLASRSERVRFGVLAEATAYRSPGLLIRAAGALDALSGGRARLGIGAGYGRLAAGTLGSGGSAGNAQSAERTGELLRLAHELWPEDGRGGGASGEERRPPVLVGGTGDARTLPLIARYAEACDLLDVPDGGATLRAKLDILAVHCRKLGRDVSDVDTSVSTLVRPDATADELVAHCAAFVDYGLDHVVLVPAGPWTRRTLATLAAAAPAIRALGGPPPETLPKVTQLDAYRMPAARVLV